MASSKLKMPPSLHQKRTTKELATPENDLSVLTAFKKLKVDAEGGCVKKTENQSKDSLKHKPESTATEDHANHKEETKDTEGWSQSLRSFCLCDDGAVGKRGRSKWKSMCRFHQLRMRKDSASHQNTLNLALAVRAHKPLLQESRFRLPDDKSPTQILRAPRFSFDLKNAKLSEGEGKLPSRTSAATESGASRSSVCDKPSQGLGATSRTVFASAASKHLSDFTSLLPQGKELAEKEKEEPVPSFDNFRDRRVNYRGQKRFPQALWPEENTSESSKPSSSVQGSGAAAPPPALSHRVDLAVERSCSQEARLDEMECSVNELTAYFDHYFVIPKEMSSMAQMMYT